MSKHPQQLTDKEYADLASSRPLYFFDFMMEKVAVYEREEKKHRQMARDLEAACYKILGIQYRDRDPGFPCWSHVKTRSYDDPRQVAEELESLKETKK